MRIRRLSIGLLLLAISTSAQQKPVKVFISADMEGIGGVVSDDQTSSKGGEYEEFRTLMTREVNAAIAGAYDAGAGEVLVTDSHGDHQNIDVTLLDPRADLVRGSPSPLGMMQGLDSSFAAAVFIGFHAGEGTADAVLSHTFDGRMTIKLNGMPVSEGGFDAAIAGDFGVPVVFLSGDQTSCQQIKDLLGPIETVAVKQAFGFYAARMMAPEKSQALIRAGVKKALERRDEIKPFKLAHPVDVQIRFKNVVDAEVVSYLPGVKRLDGNLIEFSATDMAEASRFQRAIGYIKP
jgi:D-amino peptidase